MALKKKTASGDDRAAQLAFLKANAKDLTKSAKKDAPEGFTKAPDIIKAFGLKMDKSGKSTNSSTTQAKVTRIRTGMFAEDKKTKTPAAMWVAFDMTCVGSTGKGQTPGLMITISERKLRDGTVRGKDKAFDDVMFAMQKCGIDTRSIKSEVDLFEAVDDFNAMDRADKPVVSITLSAYQGGKDVGINTKINKLLEDFEEEDGDDDDESDTDDDESDTDNDGESGDEESDDEEEATTSSKSRKSKSTAKGKSSKSKSKPAEDDEDEEEEDADEDSDDEEESEEEKESDDDDDEVEYDEADPSTWIGYECTAKPNGYMKKTKFQIVEYVSKGKKLKIKDPKGKVVTVAVAVVTVV